MFGESRYCPHMSAETKLVILRLRQSELRYKMFSLLDDFILQAGVNVNDENSAFLCLC